MPRKVKSLAVGIVVALTVPTTALAAPDLPTHLDRSFGGGDGMKVLPLEFEAIGDIEPDTEGRILIGGTDWLGGRLVRINLDGKVDPDFGLSQIPPVRQVELQSTGGFQLLASDDEGRYRYDLNESGSDQGRRHFPLSQGGRAALTPAGGLWLWRDEGPSLVLRRLNPNGDPDFTPVEESDGECSFETSCFVQRAAGLATAVDGTLLRVTERSNGSGAVVARVDTLPPLATTPQEVARYGPRSNCPAFDSWTVRTPDGGLMLGSASGCPDHGQVQFVRIAPGGGAATKYTHELSRPSNVSQPGFVQSGGFFTSIRSLEVSRAKANLSYFSVDGKRDYAFSGVVEQANFEREGLDEFIPARAFADPSGRVMLVGLGRSGNDPYRVALARWAPPGPACDFTELRQPRTMSGVARTGIRAVVTCNQNARGRLRLRVSRADASHFGLASRTIGTGARHLREKQRQRVVAHLRRSARSRLAEFAGATVYFSATLSARSSSTGERVPASVRYGEFTIDP